MSRGVVSILLFTFSAILFFSLGSLLATRQAAAADSDQIAALRAEVGALKRQRAETGTAGRSTETAVAGFMDDRGRAALVAEIKQQLKSEMGLMSTSLLRQRRQSFVELYSYDVTGANNYGTAGYLGNGYFITVKHAVVALGDNAAARRVTAIKIAHEGRQLPAKVVDTGDAQVEVDPGDWAILKVKEQISLPALNANVIYQFEFADPIFRLGNDYSKGIIVATGYVGQVTSNKLVTCLTDGHPGVSGGGVLNTEGELVGIPIGRMQGDYRFSFILPLREEMFRRVRSEQSESGATP